MAQKKKKMGVRAFVKGECTRNKECISTVVKYTFNVTVSLSLPLTLTYEARASRTGRTARSRRVSVMRVRQHKNNIAILEGVVDLRLQEVRVQLVIDREIVLRLRAAVGRGEARAEGGGTRTWRAR